MRDLFNSEVGLSDHTLGIGVAVASIAIGATVIEKHFTLSRADGGVDSAFSLEPAELKCLVSEAERAWQSLGQVTYGPTPSERKSRVFRRSIYIAADIKKGEPFTKTNLRIVRPGDGASPHLYSQIIGSNAHRDYKKGMPLSLADLL